MHYYTVSELGPNRRYTPEGYLVCTGVPIARIGTQKYAPGEVGLKGDAGGSVIVDRTPEEVFKPAHVFSYEGKDLLLDHPSDGKLVNPQTWRGLTCGTVQNVRAMPDEGIILADLIAKHPDAIKGIEDNDYREVSCGYDCRYVQDAPGHGHQEDIIGNHVALVRSGRCGITCRIGDEDTSRSQRMRTATVALNTAPRRSLMRNFFDRAMAAITTNDAAEIERLRHEADALPEVLEEQRREEQPRVEPGEDADHVHVHLHQGDAAEDPDPDRDREDTEDKRRKIRDARKRHKDARRRVRDAASEGERRLAEHDMKNAEDERRRLGDDLEEMHGEPDGDEPATKGDIAELMAMLRELLDLDDEDDDLDEAEGNGEEVADRRMRVRDARRKVRDKFRRRVHDELETEVEYDPESRGRSDLPGTAGRTGGTEGVNSVSVHDRGRRSTGDSAPRSDHLKDEWDRVVSQAEILCPGVMLTEGGHQVTFDAAAPSYVTSNRICALRRRTLDAAYGTAEGQYVLDQVTEGQQVNLRTAPCDALVPIFNAASSMMADRNRQRAVVVHDQGNSGGGNAGNNRNRGIDMTPAEQNKRNRERFKTAAAR